MESDFQVDCILVRLYLQTNPWDVELQSFVGWSKIIQCLRRCLEGGLRAEMGEKGGLGRKE